MRITLNGETHEAPDDASVADLIRQAGLEGQPCAAEVNKALVPKRAHADHRLCEGDAVELVTLVGGG